MTISSALRRYAALGPGERMLLSRAVLSLVVAHAALRVFGFRRVLARVPIVESADAHPVTPVELRRSRRYARWIETAARHCPINAQCLDRSVVLHMWLRQENLPSELRVGVRKDAGELKAHAWVELAGNVVSDDRSPTAAFVPLSVVGGGRATWSTSKSNQTIGERMDIRGTIWR